MGRAAAAAEGDGDRDDDDYYNILLNCDKRAELTTMAVLLHCTGYS